MTAPFDPHEHPHRHPDERQPPSLEDRAVADPEHARSHASVWLTGVTAGYDHRAALETVDLAVEPARSSRSSVRTAPARARSSS